MINIPKLLPIVRKEFPNVPLVQILKKMVEFSKAHPEMTDEQAIQVFQQALQKRSTVGQPFQNLVNQVGGK